MATVVWTGVEVERSRVRSTRLPPSLLQEDRIVEWGTVWLFLAAGCFGLYHATRRRRLFDGLVALFYLSIAGVVVTGLRRMQP